MILKMNDVFVESAVSTNDLLQAEMVTAEAAKDKYDVIIVGSGIAGSAMACSLGRDGRRVALLERDLREPDRIVGELLQPGGIEALQSLKLEDCIESIDGINTFGYGVYYKENPVLLTYPPTMVQKESEVSQQKKLTSISTKETTWHKTYGRSFHHGKFVMKLRKACFREPNVDVMEATVNTLMKCLVTKRVIGVKCIMKDKNIRKSIEKQIYAPLTIVADGCFSKFRKEIVTREVKSRSHFVALLLHDFQLPFPQHGHVILCNPAPVLLYQIGKNDCRVLVDIPGTLPSSSNGELQRFLRETIAPQIPEMIRPSFLDATNTQRFRSMPNCFLPTTLNNQEGLLVMGDAVNMRHPLTGGGMTVALSDVVILKKLLHRNQVPSFQNTRQVLQKCHIWHNVRRKRAMVINILAQALYTLFAAGNDPDMQILQGACFRYFQAGGIAVEHPMGLLGGILPSPILLFIHFFSVAFVGMIMLFTFPQYALRQKLSSKIPNSFILGTMNAADIFLSTPLNVLTSARVLYKAADIFFPLMKAELTA